MVHIGLSVLPRGGSSVSACVVDTSCWLWALSPSCTLQIPRWGFLLCVAGCGPTERPTHRAQQPHSTPHMCHQRGPMWVRGHRDDPCVLADTTNKHAQKLPKDCPITDSSTSEGACIVGVVHAHSQFENRLRRTTSPGKFMASHALLYRT